MLAKVPQEDEAHSPYLYAKELGHPVLSSQSGSGCFVPNDVNIGGHRNACFMLLTGPNMGGKSTLLRQVCLAVILATVEYLFQMLRTRILNF
jgi:DNA mismatch repair protein MSH6